MSSSGGRNWSRSGKICTPRSWPALLLLSICFLLVGNIASCGIPTLCKNHFLIRLPVNLRADVPNNVLKEHYTDCVFSAPSQELALLFILCKAQKCFERDVTFFGPTFAEILYHQKSD